MRTGTVSRPLKLSTVSTITIDDGSWFQYYDSAGKEYL